MQHQQGDDMSMDGQRIEARRHDEHHSYLLRLWRNSVNGAWRASLQSVQTGERHMFADLESLLAFLVKQVQPPAA